MQPRIVGCWSSYHCIAFVLIIGWDLYRRPRRISPGDCKFGARRQHSSNVVAVPLWDMADLIFPISGSHVCHGDI